MKLHEASRRYLAAGVVAAAMLVLPAVAQMGGSMKNPETDKKLAALKQSAAQNKERLHHYQWRETQRVVYKGETKKTTEYLCSYDASGKIQKLPIATPDSGEAQNSRNSNGKLRQRIKEKKTEETMDYMQQVQSLLSLYVPPSGQRIQRAITAGKASLGKSMGSGGVQVMFRDYAQPGDQMTVDFDMASKKIQSINVNTYLDEPKDVVTLSVEMASLPDGTNYAQQSVLDATAKQLQVTTINSNYQKLGQ